MNLKDLYLPPPFNTEIFIIKHNILGEPIKFSFEVVLAVKINIELVICYFVVSVIFKPEWML